MFFKNSMNLPVTEGHFVVIDKNSVDVPWLQSDATTSKKLQQQHINCQPLSYLVGRIVHGNLLLGMTRVDCLLLKEFLPQNANCWMSLNSRPCAGIKKVINTPFIGYVKNTDISDLAFVFLPVYLENAMHAVAAGMDNAFVCQYMYHGENWV